MDYKLGSILNARVQVLSRTTIPRGITEPLAIEQGDIVRIMISKADLIKELFAKKAGKIEVAEEIQAEVSMWEKSFGTGEEKRHANPEPDY